MKRNKEWLNNRNATKNAKMYSVNIYRDASRQLHLMGGDTEVFDRKTHSWHPVNTRAFGELLNTQGVHVK